MNKLKKIIVSVVLCELSGIIGSFFTFKAIPGWYASLNKPFFSPPNWIFGPVWTSLYFLMGVAFYLIWNKGWKKTESQKGRKYFAIQLILNMLWSIIFFGWKMPGLALVEMMVLWFFIFKTIETFKKISPAASYLLIPYLAWVSFAMVLNAAVVVLN